MQQLNSGRRGFEGSFAEYAVVGSGYVVWLPEVDGEGILRDEVVAPVLCGGVTAFAALKASGVVGGEWVVVSGAAGGVGALAVQYARAMGYRVVAVDAGSEKEEGCLRAGAEVYVDACGERLAEEVVMEVTEKGAAAVLVCAGAGRAYQTALGMLAPFGTLVCVGIPPPDQLVNFHPLLFIDRGIRIIGSAVGTRGDILEALEFVRRGLVKPDIKIIGLDDLNAVAQDFGKVCLCCFKVVDTDRADLWFVGNWQIRYQVLRQRTDIGCFRIHGWDRRPIGKQIKEGMENIMSPTRR